MISSANDRVDREDIRQQSDETYQFWFYYDTSQCAAVHNHSCTPSTRRLLDGVSDSLVDSQVWSSASR